MQHKSNVRAVYAQQPCNMHATHTAACMQHTSPHAYQPARSILAAHRRHVCNMFATPIASTAYMKLICSAKLAVPTCLPRSCGRLCSTTSSTADATRRPQPPSRRPSAACDLQKCHPGDSGRGHQLAIKKTEMYGQPSRAGSQHFSYSYMKSKWAALGAGSQGFSY